MSERNWHEKVFFGIHYDLHARAGDTELGAEFTPEHLRAVLEKIRPDWVQCDCKGHPGYTSWPTMVGSTSPGMVRDQLRIYRDVTADLGIRLGMHYSGVIDQRALELHPEWAALDPAGQAQGGSTCRMSPYLENLMIPQMIEIIDNYDVDGFWVDGENWGAVPCWCASCRTEFTRQTGIRSIPAGEADQDWLEWLDFHRRLFVGYVTRYTEAIHERKRDCLVCSNWMYTLRQPEAVEAPVDYISGDFTPSWGANRAALEGRFMESRQMTWDLMAWGFTFGSAEGRRGPNVMKPAVHLCQEVAGLVGLGGAVMVYMKPERTGHLVGWHHDILDHVARFCRERQAVCHQSRTASQVAVLHLPETFYARNSQLYNLGRAHIPVEGALHAMMDTGRSVDILCRERVLGGLSMYKLVIAARQDHINDDVMSVLLDYVKAGGNLLMTGVHLAENHGGVVGVKPAGELIDRHIPVESRGRAVVIWGPSQPVVPLAGTEVISRALLREDPRCGSSGQAVITCRKLGAGKVMAVHGGVFEGYFYDHSPRVRRLIDDLVGRFGIDWQVSHDGPPWCELIVRCRNDRLVVNLINRGAADTLTPDKPVLESIVPISEITVTIRRKKPPNLVRMTPAEPVDWYYRDGLVRIRVGSLAIHCALEIA